MRFAFTLFSALLFSFCYAQNVGIGITTPAVPLHIRNNGSELLRLQGNDPHLTFFDNSGVVKGFVLNHGNNVNLGTTTGNTTGLVQFFTHNNLGMVLHPNTNIGIGTAEPNFKLTVQTNGSDWGIVHRNTDVIVGTWIGNNSGITGGWYGTYSNHPLSFFTNNGGPQITLLQTGNVGIGTINPLAKLHIKSDGNAITLSGNSPFIYYHDANGIPKGFLWNKGGNNMDLGTEVGNNSGEVKLTIRGFEALTVQNDGRVRVGTMASIHAAGLGGLPKFTSFGPLCIKDNFYPGADEWSWDVESINGRIWLSKNGSSRAFVDDNGDWNAFSDMSLKEDIRIYKNVLDNILKLEVSTYHYKWNTTGKSSFGLIAQNVVRYFPEIVSESQDKEGQKLLAISYAKTGVLAIKAIQEQQEIIETQQKRIDAQQEINELQQKTIDELKMRLSKLENKLK